MKSICSQGTSLLGLLRRSTMDDSGGEVIEYALIAGLIVVASITVITAIGGRITLGWQWISSSM